MYCVKCGVHLADGEGRCPLCGTRAYHPDFTKEDALPLYPSVRMEQRKMNRPLLMLIVTLVLAVVALQMLLFDWRLSGAVSWSYFASGGILCAYFAFLFPFWLRHPNPVVLLPVDIAVFCLYVLGIDLLFGNGWFLPLALPLFALVAILTVTPTAVLYYVRRGGFFVYGGVALALGASLVLTEWLIDRYFGIGSFVFWSLSPLLGLSLVGAFLLLVGIVRPLRMRLEKKFFI